MRIEIFDLLKNIIEQKMMSGCDEKIQILKIGFKNWSAILHIHIIFSESTFHPTRLVEMSIHHVRFNLIFDVLLVAGEEADVYKSGLSAGPRHKTQTQRKLNQFVGIFSWKFQ